MGSLLLTWISNHINSKVWVAPLVREWLSTFILHFTMDIITYQCIAAANQKEQLKSHMKDRWKSSIYTTKGNILINENKQLHSVTDSLSINEFLKVRNAHFGHCVTRVMIVCLIGAHKNENSLCNNYVNYQYNWWCPCSQLCDVELKVKSTDSWKQTNDAKSEIFCFPNNLVVVVSEMDRSQSSACFENVIQFFWSGQICDGDDSSYDWCDQRNLIGRYCSWWPPTLNELRRSCVDCSQDDWGGYGTFQPWIS